MQEMPEGRKSKPIKSEGRGDPYTTVERPSGPTAGVGPQEQHGNMEVDKGPRLHHHATDPGATSTMGTAAAATTAKQQGKEQSGSSTTTKYPSELEVGPGPLNIITATSMKQGKAQSGTLTTTTCSAGLVVGPGHPNTATATSMKQNKEQSGAWTTTACSTEPVVGPGPLNDAAAASMKQGKEQSGALTTTACSAEPVVGLGPLNTDTLQAHGVPTNGRKRTIGGKNTKWAVSTQQTKKYMSACYLCAKQFMDSEPRLQQWGDRNTCQRYVHGHCVHGGISVRHEFIAKRVEDTNIVDKLIQNLQHTEAELSRAVLPFAEDQASTTAPSTNAGREDDQAEFSEERESKVRMEVEFLDLSWFTHISWDTIRALPGTTYVQIPKRHQFAIHQAQYAILRCILNYETNTQECEHGWKLLVLSSWLLLGKLAGKDTAQNCAGHFDERLSLFWNEDWATLWGIIKGECGQALARANKQTEEERRNTQVKRVSTLARAGERGRALAAACQAPPERCTKEVLKEIRQMYLSDPDPAVPITGVTISALFHNLVAAQVPSTLKQMPRLSEPGPLGMRAEHWFSFSTQVGEMDVFSKVIVQLATGNIPSQVLMFFRSGQVTPLAKPTGGHRPLLLTSFLRRLALKALITVRRGTVREAVGPHQYGVGAKDGANCLIKTIQCATEADHDRVLVALDLKAAFQHVSRKAMLWASQGKDPELACVYSRWYTGKTTHRATMSSAEFQDIHATSGVDQGCPLSAFGFAAAVGPTVQQAVDHIGANLDPEAFMMTYLDDWYLWVLPEHIKAAASAIAHATGSIELQLQSGKTQIWVGNCNNTLDSDLQQFVTAMLSCLGGHLKIQGDQEDAAIELGNEQTMMTKTTMVCQSLAGNINELCQAGLKKQAGSDLFATYTSAASQHALRMSFVSQHEAQKCATQVVNAWSNLHERNCDSPLFFCHSKEEDLVSRQRSTGGQWHHGRHGGQRYRV